LYIGLAQSFEAGDIQAGLRAIKLNTFPVILVSLHRMGLDWPTAGTWWSVVLSSLVVLPLFGWARRQFDDRAAIVASLLYAVHPKMIEWSPEITRDPTFWFLFMLSIYLLWRAVTEVRVGLFLAAGVTTTLAWLTRFEGLFLLIPLVLWTFWRWRALASGRGRLLVGAVLSVTALPAVLVLVNAGLYLLTGNNALGSTRWIPLELVKTWLTAMVGLRGNGNSLLQENGAAVGLSFDQMLRTFFPTMTRGLSPAFALLMFGGLFKWRRLWLRCDHQALFITSLAFLGGIWVNLWYVRASCPRYAFPIVLMSAVFAALGLMSLMRWCAGWMDRMSWGVRLWPAGLIAPTAVVVALASIDVFMADYHYRGQEKALGQWVRDEFGPRATLAGPIGVGSTVGYYAKTDSCVFSAEARPALIRATVQEANPDVLLLQRTRYMSYDQWNELLLYANQLSFVAVDRQNLPDHSDNVQVFVRASEGSRIASRFKATSTNRQ
jgi:hypothetical protein